MTKRHPWPAAAAHQDARRDGHRRGPLRVHRGNSRPQRLHPPLRREPRRARCPYPYNT
ncbi:hypothetical protein STAFG_2694 [Streptomyces afghaniensis 772]|uniref:Uncharacterized protein n=1 Tax=Streptomyces afghaniensis 772 TaxID=1283301 RepID=S4ML38_9ACTN|nr:hypothetical protein STAFG_2694 [Streptomyces afghaniensis 772]